MTLSGVWSCLLVVGVGRRAGIGAPTALLRCTDGTALLTAQVERMLSAASSRGLESDVIVVLGPALEHATRLVPRGAWVVQNPDHHLGLSCSLRTGLQAVSHSAPGV